MHGYVVWRIIVLQGQSAPVWRQASALFRVWTDMVGTQSAAR